MHVIGADRKEDNPNSNFWSPTQINNNWGLRISKTNTLLNLIHHKDPYKAKYQFLINELDIAPVSNKEFLDIQATIECRLTLKCVRDMIRTYSQMHHTDNFS